MLGTFIVGAVVLLGIILALRSILKSKKTGGCVGCSGCSGKSSECGCNK